MNRDGKGQLAFGRWALQHADTEESGDDVLGRSLAFVNEGGNFAPADLTAC